MTARPPLAAAWGVLAATAARAQAPPDAAELSRIRAVVEARETADAMAIRRRWRPAVGLGLVATTSFDVSTDDGREVRFEGGFAGALSAMVTRAITERFDVFARVELAAPQRASVLPPEAQRAVAATPCAGSRRFDLPQGAGGLAAADLGLRMRLVDARSPFFIGFGLRLALRWNDVSGPWRVWCDALDGARTLVVQGDVSDAPLVPDLGATLDTGYRFGPQEAWEVGLRLSLGGIADGDINARLGQLYVMWSPW